MDSSRKKLDKIAVADEDGVKWVRAAHAMSVLDVPRSSYISWRNQRGYCKTVRYYPAPKSRKAPQGFIVVLKLDEVVEAFAEHRKRRRWSEEDSDFLQDWYGIRTNRWIARRLGRTVKSVASKAESLGLSLKPEECGMGIKDVAEILDVPEARVRGWVRHNRKELLARARNVSHYIVTTPNLVIKFLDARPEVLRRIDRNRVRFLRRMASAVSTSRLDCK